MRNKNDQERRPDLADESYEETARKVDELMQGPKADEAAPKFKTAKTAKPGTEPQTAPEIPDLPVPKEPLTIKILKNEDKKESSDEAEPDVSNTVVSKKIEDTDKDTDPETVTPANTTEEEGASESTADTKKIAQTKSQEDSYITTDASSDIEDTLDDHKTEEAVKDIIAKESDDLLEADDEKIAKAFSAEKPSKWQRFKSGWKNYWANPKKRWLTIGILTAIFIAAWIVPVSRYFMLNTAGARAKLSVRVLDQSTRQPLKNVRVTAGGTTAVSDNEGFARLTSVKLGPTTLQIERVAFAPINQNITVGWGSNPQGEVMLDPTGVQYTFIATDYLSGKPIEKVEASSGEASAYSDKDGTVVLTVDKPSDENLEVTLKGDGLREEKRTIPTEIKDQTSVQMVPGRKHVFVTKRDGTYDVYSVYADGKEEKKILAGTGSERDDIMVLVHPTEEMAAVVSTRDNQRNSDGFLLSTLTLIDLNDASTQKVTQSERVQLVGWSGDRLVFVQVAAGTSAANPKRHRLLSHDYKTNQTDEIAAANYFNDVLMVGNKAYYAPSSTYQPSAANSKLYKVNADGSNRETVFDAETWNIFRINHDKLAISIGQNWYELDLTSPNAQPKKLEGQPANITSRVYIDSPDGKNSLWVDERDGKGVLLSYQPSTKNESTLLQEGGLRTPVRWLNNSVVIFRVNTEDETADYALSLNGGEPKKIRDVTNTNSVDTWYYY